MGFPMVFSKTSDWCGAKVLLSEMERRGEQVQMVAGQPTVVPHRSEPLSWFIYNSHIITMVYGCLWQM